MSDTRRHWVGRMELNALTAMDTLDRLRARAREKGRMLHFEVLRAPDVVNVYEVSAHPVLLKIWEHADPKLRARRERQRALEQQRADAEARMRERVATEQRRRETRARWLTPAYRVAFARDLHQRGVLSAADLQLVENARV